MGQKLRSFITGITGFIGSHVAELFLSQGKEVLGAGYRGWRPGTPDELSSDIELLRWDIRKPAPPNIRQRVVEFNPDVVFHFAAISIPALCGTDSPTEQAIAVNVHGTSHLLDLVEELPGNPRTVFSSTCHVYGRVDRASAVVAETTELDPISAYGETKLECEQEILRRCAEGSVNATIARGFHHIGPRQPSGLMLTDWLEQLVDPKTQELHVRSTNSHLDMVDVRDAARAYEKLASSDQSGEIFNLGSGRVSNSGEVLKDLLRLADRDLAVIAKSDEERWNTIADISKLNSLGWEAATPYTTTLRDMLDSYK